MTNFIPRALLLSSLFSLALFNSHAGIAYSKAITANWSTPTTWVSGSVPGATDSVVIVSGAVINTTGAAACGAINIIGTLTQASGNTLTVAGDGITSFGTVAGTGVLGYSSNAVRTIQLSGNWTFNGTSGNPGETVVFAGSSNQYLSGVITTGTGGNGLVTVSMTGGGLVVTTNFNFDNKGIKIISGTLDPNGNLLTISTLNPSGGTLLVDATTFAGNYAATTTNNPGAGDTIVYTNDLPTVSSAITYQNLIFSGNGTASTDGTLTIQGNLLSTGGGTLNFGANNVSLSGTVTLSTIAGFTSSGTVAMKKTAGTAVLTGAINASTLTINGNGGTLDLGYGLVHSVGTLTMTKGTMLGDSATLIVNTSWGGTGAVFIAGSGTVVYSGTGTQTISVNPTYNNLVLSTAGTAKLTATPLMVSGDLTLSAGTILLTSGATAYTLDIGGDWINDGGSFTNTNSTVVLDGTASQYIRGTSNTGFYNLTIDNTAANIVLSDFTTVNHQLTLTGGLLDASQASLNIASGAPAISGSGTSEYIITGNGSTSTGTLIINNIPVNTTTLFPIGTASYYLPLSLNPAAVSGQAYAAFVYQGVTTNGLESGPAMNSAGLSQVVDAVWGLTQISGSGLATLTLNWSASGTALEGSALQAAGTAIGISPFSGGFWQIATGTGSVTTETAMASFSAFSAFGVGLNGYVLADIFQDFEALRQGNAVLLSWDAAAGPGANFVIQRSLGIAPDQWQTIGKLPADSSPEPGSYHLTDPYPSSGVNNYRIVLEGPDNFQQYSAIRTLDISSTSPLWIFPNPASNTLSIRLSVSQAATLRLLNPLGQIIKQWTKPAGEVSGITLSVSGYPPGQYVLACYTAEGLQGIFPLVIVR